MFSNFLAFFWSNPILSGSCQHNLCDMTQHDTSIISTELDCGSLALGELLKGYQKGTKEPQVSV